MKTWECDCWSQSCRRPLVAAVAAALLLSLVSTAQVQVPRQPQRTPAAQEKNPERNAYLGETYP